VRLLGISFL